MQDKEFLYQSVHKAWEQFKISAELMEKYKYQPRIVWKSYIAGNRKMMFFFDAFKDPCHVDNFYIESTFVAHDRSLSIDIYQLHSHNSY
ncbi:hypothetical protein [Lactobacillus taiwanensis]|uniref:hypothetical protein n=1 Tax=Lactobacillus taiwanensis TaxID=508451 RepID=UPI00272C0F21|nr:hypothetical protein [Lactobacillus taiwanensis]